MRVPTRCALRALGHEACKNPSHDQRDYVYQEATAAKIILAEAPRGVLGISVHAAGRLALQLPYGLRLDFSKLRQGACQDFMHKSYCFCSKRLWPDEQGR